MVQNLFADTAEILIHLSIGIPQDTQSQQAEFFIPLPICLLACRIIVLGAIQLNDKLGAGNVEIDNGFADHLLPMHHHRKIFQKIIPKVPLFFCHRLA